MLQFNQIPRNVRVPLFYAEINPAQAPYESNARLLLVGQMDVVNGSATPGEAMMIVDNAEGLFGANSMLASMYARARINAPFQEIWALPLDDNPAGVKATGTITVQNMPVTQATTVAVWIGRTRIQTIAYVTDTNATLAARLCASIVQAITDDALPLTSATVVGAVITLTAKHKGEQGNTLRLDTNYAGGEGPTSAKVFALTQFSGGTGDPNISSFLVALGDDEFDWIGCPYSDAVNLGAISVFLNGQSGRWSPMQQLYGHYFTVKSDTVANLATYGLTLNDPHISIMGVYKYQSPSWDVCAAYAAVCAEHLQTAPELSRPLQTLQLVDILPAKSKADRFNITSRQSLYFDGISCCTVSRANTVHLDRVITTYRLNAWGSPDASWLDVNTLAQNMYGIRYLRTKLTGEWGRAALVDANPDGIQGFATDKAVRDTVLHGYAELQELGVVENYDIFAQMLIVERSKTNADRLDFYLPADQVNALRIMAVNYVSHLQYGKA